MLPLWRCLCGNRVGVAKIIRRTRSECSRLLHGERRPLLPFEVDTEVGRDVLLFRYENPSFYRILNLFAVSQLVFWSCTARFMFGAKNESSSSSPQSHRRLREVTSDAAGDRNWFTNLLGGPKSNAAMAATCLGVGFSVAFAAWFFTRRTVHHLMLLRGGQRVRLTCYSPWPFPDRIVEVPVDHVSCLQGRGEFAHKSIRVMGHPMFFVLDRDGEFTNTKLFDNTVGVKRNWKRANE